MMIIGLSGKAHSGKTTLAAELEQLYGWNHLSLAKELKHRAYLEFGLSIAQVNGTDKEKLSRYVGEDGKHLTNREVLIRLGAGYRSIDKDYWIKQLSFNENKVNIISDVRFQNEADWIKSEGGLIVRLERAIELRGFESQDKSETDLDHYEFSWRVPESMNVDMHDISTIADRIYALAELSFPLYR